MGEFVVRYPLAGTTYTLTDHSGAVYSKTYTGTPPEITLHISVGNVTTPRSFSLKAQNGACSYSTGQAGDSSEDIVSTLLALGYNEKEARAAAKGIPAGTEVGEGVRLALKNLLK